MGKEKRALKLELKAKEKEIKVLEETVDRQQSQIEQQQSQDEQQQSQDEQLRSQVNQLQSQVNQLLQGTSPENLPSKNTKTEGNRWQQLKTWFIGKNIPATVLSIFVGLLFTVYALIPKIYEISAFVNKLNNYEETINKAVEDHEELRNETRDNFKKLEVQINDRFGKLESKLEHFLQSYYSGENPKGQTDSKKK